MGSFCTCRASPGIFVHGPGDTVPLTLSISYGAVCIVHSSLTS